MDEPGAALGLRVVTDVDDARWNALIGRDPHAGALHQPAVQRILAAALPRTRAAWLEVEDASGALCAGLPLLVRGHFGLLHVVSGAAGLYGGPVVDPGVPQAATRLARAFLRIGGWRTWRRELVWSGRSRPPGDWPGLRPLPTAFLPVDFDAEFDAWYEESLRPARRKERRRLQRRGFRVRLAEDRDFLPAFEEIYRERASEWGTTPLPARLFAALMGAAPQWKVFVAHDDRGDVAGAHFCVDLGDELFAWLGTTRRVEGGSVATLLIEAELRWCQAAGRRGLNLGTSADLTGVEDFKRGISAHEDPRWILRWQRGRGDH